MISVKVLPDDANFDANLLLLFQDIPGYCSTLTLLVLCFDRHQRIRHPEMAPLPIVWILGLVWAISIALVLPYMAYITHVDLSVSGIKLYCDEPKAKQ